MKLGPRPITCSAFTLIELVISSSLMALILASGYVCLSSALSSQKMIQARAEVAQTARVAMGLISADLRSACLLSKDFQFLGMDRMLGDIEADNLDFGTHNYTPRRLGEGDFCEVSYFVGLEPESGKFALWRRRDPTLDDEPLAGGSREEIARGIRGLRFEYYDGWEWFDDWGDPEGKGKKENSLIEQPNLSGLPEAVRITMWFDASPKKSAAADETSEEEPLVFQTITRLNLVRAAQGASGAAEDSGENTGNTNARQQNPPTGGSQ